MLYSTTNQLNFVNQETNNDTSNTLFVLKPKYFHKRFAVYLGKMEIL